MGEERCETCLFKRPGGYGGGWRCHRYAPRPGSNFREWPTVKYTDWCGEYHPKDPQNED